MIFGSPHPPSTRFPAIHSIPHPSSKEVIPPSCHFHLWIWNKLSINGLYPRQRLHPSAEKSSCAHLLWSCCFMSFVMWQTHFLAVLLTRGTSLSFLAAVSSSTIETMSMVQESGFSRETLLSTAVHEFFLCALDVCSPSFLWACSASSCHELARWDGQHTGAFPHYPLLDRSRSVSSYFLALAFERNRFGSTFGDASFSASLWSHIKKPDHIRVSFIDVYIYKESIDSLVHSIIHPLHPGLFRLHHGSFAVVSLD